MALAFDYTSFFNHHIIIYKSFGFWKTRDEMKCKKLYSIYKNICILISCVFLLSQIIYMVIHRADIDEFISTIFVTITFSIILIKMLVLYQNMDRIESIIDNLKRPLFQIKNIKQYNIAKEAKSLAVKYFYVCVFFGTSTDIFWSITPFLGETKTTYEKGWYPYDLHKSLNYKIFYLFQGFSCIMNTFLCLNQGTFYATLAVQVGVQCDLLCDTLNNLESYQVQNNILFEIEEPEKLAITSNKEVFSTEMSKNLIVCILHHKEILE